MAAKRAPKKTSARPKSPTQRAAKLNSKKQPASQSAARKPARRADFGAPVEAFFARQPPHLRDMTNALRRLIEAAAPGAAVSLKWGMPFYSIDGRTVCAIGSHKAHVNLILSGPPGTFNDPKGLLVGDGKTGRHLKLTSIDELPTAAVRGWLKAAVALATQK